MYVIPQWQIIFSTREHDGGVKLFVANGVNVLILGRDSFRDDEALGSQSSWSPEGAMQLMLMIVGAILLY